MTTARKAAPATAPDDDRLTPQRRAVLAVLRASRDHPSATEVFERVRAVSPGIGAATVYRSLAHLVATGHATELSVERGLTRYDANVDRHDHLVCDGCGQVADIVLDAVSDVVAGLDTAVAFAARSGFTLTSYDLRLRGLCAACRESTPAPATGRGAR